MLSYVEEVEAFFIGLVRRGLALRPSDVAVVQDWEARGVPLEVVRRGIETGLARFLASANPRDPVPVSLKWFRADVEREFEVHQRALAQGVLPVVQNGPCPPSRDLQAEAVAILAARVEAASSEAESSLLSRAIGRIRDAAKAGNVAEELLAVDDELAAAVVASSPALAARVEAVVRAAQGRGLGPAAVASIRRAQTRAAATELGYKSLVASLLEGE